MCNSYYRLAMLLLCVVAACQAPTDADDTPTGPRVSHGATEVTAAAGLKQPRPSLVTTACVNGSLQMVVTDTWNNQTIDGTQPLTITLTLKGAHFGSEVVASAFLGPFDQQPSFGTTVVNAYLSNDPAFPFTWSLVSTVGASASGTFSDVASTLRQPKSGWPAC